MSSVHLNGNILGVVLQKGSVAIIAFRGTQTMQDWTKTNFKYNQIKFKSTRAKVHEGFHKGYFESQIANAGDGMVAISHGYGCVIIVLLFLLLSLSHPPPPTPQHP